MNPLASRLRLGSPDLSRKSGPSGKAGGLKEFDLCVIGVSKSAASAIRVNEGLPLRRGTCESSPFEALQQWPLWAHKIKLPAKPEVYLKSN